MKNLIALVVFAMILNLNLSTARAAQWDFLVDMTNGLPKCTYYIESSTVFCDKLSKEEVIFHAFLKSLYTSEGRRQRLLAGHGRAGAENISYSVFLEYFRWTNGVKYYAVDSETVCTADGSVVHEMSYTRSWHNWNIAKPGAISDVLFDAVFAVLCERLRS